MIPPRRAPKPKLLLDEGFPRRKTFARLNRYCDVKHIAHDIKLSGATDATVYQYACEHERIMVTFNDRHFKPLVSATTMTVIGVSMKLSGDDMDKKLTSLMKRLKPTDFKGQCRTITAAI